MIPMRFFQLGFPGSDRKGALNGRPFAVNASNQGENGNRPRVSASAKLRRNRGEHRRDVHTSALLVAAVRAVWRSRGAFGTIQAKGFRKSVCRGHAAVARQSIRRV
jgi:hypothetical protein